MLPYRSRYYQGQMDMEALKPGMAFSMLPKAFIIFICKFDPFGLGLYRYSFDMQCREADLRLTDGVCRVFLNTQGKAEEHISQELLRFLGYVENASPKYAGEDWLIRRMTADGLLEEIPKLDSDVAYRQEMFEKYHIKLQ